MKFLVRRQQVSRNRGVTPLAPGWIVALAARYELERSRKVGLKGSVDVLYAHSMSTRYPTLFVGLVKDQILRTTTIKMFDSHDAWQGDGSGDGNKQRLMDTLAIAIPRH